MFLRWEDVTISQEGSIAKGRGLDHKPERWRSVLLQPLCLEYVVRGRSE